MPTPSLASRLPSSKHTLYLVDISSFIFRAFFAIRSLRNKTNEPTNAVYGVATMLARLAEEAKPEHLAVVYDSKEITFRKEIYPEYKANRTQPPDDLVPQFARIEQLVKAFEIHSYRQNGVEADDLIATLSKRWCAASPKNHVVIVTSDKDLMQLVSERLNTWDTMSNKFYGPAEVEEKFGVRPDQIRDYLALLGDSSDNIPGVPGVGTKTATDLLKEFQTLENLLKAANAGKIPGKRGETLKNHEADARLSAQLATLREDLDLEIPLESLRYHFHVTDECVKLLKELDFHTLVSRWKTSGAAEVEVSPSLDTPEPPKEAVELDPATPLDEGPSQGELTFGSGAVSVSGQKKNDRFRTVNTEDAFQSLLKGMDQAKEFGFDLETTSLNPRAAEIVGISICYDPEFACYIPVGHRNSDQPQLSKDRVIQALKPFLESDRYKKIGQNLKYDWSVLREHGIIPKGIGADTMIASYLLDPDGRHSLQMLAAKYLDYEGTTYEQVCGKGKDQISFDQVSIDTATHYSAEDAWVAVQLWKKLLPLLEAEKLLDVLGKIDLPMIDILTKMEIQGVCIDVSWLKKLSEEFALELEKIEERVKAYTSGPVNLNSPKQLGQLLFEELKLPTQGKTKTGFSTDASVLEALAPLHEVPRLLLEYREISKLKGTYVDPLPELRDPKTGRIHASFHQTVAATGRLSSSDPNLQNIPIRTDRGMRIRRAFIPSEGNILLSADYSQIELRLLAHMSQDPELRRAFQNDEDVHRKTASDLFGVPVDHVDDRQRSIAKAINFGLMYGKTAFGLAQELKIPRKEAQEIIHRYFEKYRSVKDFLDGQIQLARGQGFVTSLMGRRRWLPDIRSKNPSLRGNAERMAMNTPIQGTAADLMKLAMIEMDHRLAKDGFRSHLLIQVHDEVVLDCPKEEVLKVQKMITEVMENAATLSVPLRVNSATGDNWMNL